MSEHISLDDYINVNGRLIYSGVGTSMMPLLRPGRDLFVIEKNQTGMFKIGDVVLFKRNAHRYVLHRIVYKGEGGYVIMGDNCRNAEAGIKENEIVGIMTAYIRNGKMHYVHEPMYRLYSLLMIILLPIRAVINKLISIIKRLFCTELIWIRQ